MPDDIDQLINAAVTRVIEQIGPIVDQAVARHTKPFRDHHERLAETTGSLSRSVAAGVARLDSIEDNVARLDEKVTDLDSRTMTMEALVYSAYQRGRADAIPPAPPELVAACAQPTGKRTKLILDVFGRNLTAIVSGGRDPQEAWRDMHESVCDHAKELTDAAVPSANRPPRGTA